MKGLGLESRVQIIYYIGINTERTELSVKALQEQFLSEENEMNSEEWGFIHKYCFSKKMPDHEKFRLSVL